MSTTICLERNCTSITKGDKREMTKLEALAKDCIENHTHRLIDRPSKQDIYTREESIYISGYKECERQNKNKIIELEQKLEQPEKDLTDYQFNYPKILDLDMKRKAERQIFQGIVEKKNEQLTKAKELLNEFLDFELSCMERGIKISDKIRAEAEQFLKE